MPVTKIKSFVSVSYQCPGLFLIFVNTRDDSRSFEKVQELYIAQKVFGDALASFSTNDKEPNGGYTNVNFRCDLYANKC